MGQAEDGLRRHIPTEIRFFFGIDRFSMVRSSLPPSAGGPVCSHRLSGRRAAVCL